MNNKILNKLIEKSYEMTDLPVSEKLHFSFIFHKRKMLCVGWNNGWFTHPLAKKFGHRYSVTHSELAAIKALPYSKKFLKKCTLINIRIGKNGKVAMAKPCKHCQEMLNYFNIKRIIYTDNNGNFIELN